MPWGVTSFDPIVSAMSCSVNSMRTYPPFLLPFCIVLFAIVVLLPLGLMLAGSLWFQGLTLSSYAALANPRYLKMALNSVLIAGGVTLASLVIGTSQAFLLERIDGRWRRFFGVVYFLPLLIPPYIHAIVWTFCLGSTSAVNRCLAALFPDCVPRVNIYSIGGVIYILTIAYAPIVTLCVISGFKSLDGRLEEAGLLTSTPWAVMRKISLPLLRPHILCGGLIVGVLTIVNFEVPDLMRTRVYATEIFIQFSAFYDARKATALSLPLIGLTFGALVIVQQMMQKKPYVVITGDRRVARRLAPASGPWRLAYFLMGFWLGLSILVPLGVLLAKSLPWQNFRTVLRTSTDEILFSLILSGLSALVLMAASCTWCYLMERSRRWSRFLDLLALLPFAVPGTVLGIGLILLWNRSWAQWLYGSSLILLIAYLAHFIPFTIRIMAANIKQIDIKLEEAAYLASSSWFTTVRKILLPLLRPGLFLSFFLGFVLCFGDLAAPLLVMPPGRETVPIKIYNLLHYGADQMVAALCLVIVLIIFIAAGMLYTVYDRYGKIK